MQPQMKPAIEKATRKQFPQGIPAFGTDALRLSFASLATQSRDLRFDMARVEGNRNFCNKLWNAARYVLMNVEGHDVRSADATFSLADRWIRSRLKVALERVQKGFADYRLDLVAAAIYEFTWREYCDWYLELSKAVLFSDEATEAEKRGSRHTLIHTLEALLRALHPLAPFITEEIWQRVRLPAGVGGATIMTSEFPAPDAVAADAGTEPEMRWVMGFIEGVLQIRGEMDIPLSRKLDVLLQNGAPIDGEYAKRNLPYLSRLAGVTEPRILKMGETPPISAVALLGTLEILVPMAGVIDPQAELERLDKRLRKAEGDSTKLQDKLDNAAFARNAPADVVEKDRVRLAELRTEIGQLQAQKARVTALRSAPPAA
jgi:valyl-tRNA synthetase